MAFLAALPEVIGPLLGRVGASVGARAAAGAVEGGASGGAGGGGASLMSKVTKVGPMPIPHMGSNGIPGPPAMKSPIGTPNTILNADQFR